MAHHTPSSSGCRLRDWHLGSWLDKNMILHDIYLLTVVNPKFQLFRLCLFFICLAEAVRGRLQSEVSLQGMQNLETFFEAVTYSFKTLDINIYIYTNVTYIYNYIYIKNIVAPCSSARLGTNQLTLPCF